MEILVICLLLRVQGLVKILLYILQHWPLFPWNLLKGQTTFSMSVTMTLLAWNCGRQIQPFISERHSFTTRASGFLVTVHLNYIARKAFSSYSQILLSKHQNMMILKNSNNQAVSVQKVYFTSSSKREQMCNTTIIFLVFSVKIFFTVYKQIVL